MKNYVCNKCGSMDLFIKQNGEHQTGLYCSDCGKWIKWVSKSELALVEKFIEEQKKEKEFFIETTTDNNLCMVDNWNKLKTYIESGIFFDDSNDGLKKVYNYMLQLEKEN
jgi:uncharacterized Zn finger protein (UPF0148 family)